MSIECLPLWTQKNDCVVFLVAYNTVRCCVPYIHSDVSRIHNSMIGQSVLDLKGCQDSQKIIRHGRVDIVFCVNGCRVFKS